VDIRHRSFAVSFSFQSALFAFFSSGKLPFLPHVLIHFAGFITHGTLTQPRLMRVLEPLCAEGMGWLHALKTQRPL
jgi:hypothetical protein